MTHPSTSPSSADAPAHRRTPESGAAPPAAPRWLLPALAVVCAAAATASVMQLGPPAAAGGDFAVDAAMETVRTLAAERRGTGTEGHAAARREIERRLAALGAETEVQATAMTDLEPNGPQRILWVENVVARLPGSGESGDGGALLLTAHYDSVADGPGAADDAAGVATVLEVMRAIAAGPPPRRDVIALLTDAEELGLVGARAFAARHRWADDVAAVLNFEARGVRGPSIMFETGRGSGRLVDLYAEVAPAPVANSMSEAVYSLMPNDTDFSVYRGRGLAGLNFAFIHGVAPYHRENDTPDRLSAATLGHQGATALALTRALAAAPDDAFGGGERSFFNLPGIGLVVYPRAWTPPLAVAAFLLAAAALVVAWRRRPAGAPWPGTVRTAAAGVATVAATLLAVAILERLVGASFGLGPVMIADRALWYLGWGVAAAGVAWFVWGRLLGAAPPAAAAAAGLVPWGLLVLLAAFFLPGLAHLLVWPLAAAAVALLLLALPAGGGAGAGRVGTAAAVALLFAALVLVLLWTPVAALLPVALGPRAAVVLALFAALAVCLLAPVLALLPRPGDRGWLLPALVAAAGLGLVLAAGASAGYDDERLRPTSLYHLQDADGGEAWVMTLDTPPEPWTAGFVPPDAGERPFPRFFEGAGAELAAAASPTLPLPPPKLDLEAAEELADGGRRLTLRLASQRGAARLALVVRSPEPLAALTIGGVPVDLGRDLAAGAAVSGHPARARVRLDGAPPGGWEVVAEQAAAAPLHFDLVDWRWELPPGFAGDEPPAGLHARLRSGVFHRADTDALGALGAAAGAAEGDGLLTTPGTEP